MLENRRSASWAAPAETQSQASPAARSRPYPAFRLGPGDPTHAVPLSAINVFYPMASPNARRCLTPTITSNRQLSIGQNSKTGNDDTHRIFSVRSVTVTLGVEPLGSRGIIAPKDIDTDPNHTGCIVGIRRLLVSWTAPDRRPIRMTRDPHAPPMPRRFRFRSTRRLEKPRAWTASAPQLPRDCGHARFPNAGRSSL